VYRTVLACVFTAIATAAVTPAISSASSASSPSVKVIDVGQTVFFARQDLICVNEPASGAPRFNTAGVACSSYAKPYSGIGVWITGHRMVVTRPPNMKIVASYRR
jgi:hypothetical protein